MNYTVLVVDDEAEQRSALISRVDWSAAGFEVIGEAENGVEALDLIDALEPDLILTDIRMPMISGLELAAKVYEMRPATQIVILSGYDSFDYARTAINYNIISYLLKPITSSELSEELFCVGSGMCPLAAQPPPNASAPTITTAATGFHGNFFFGPFGPFGPLGFLPPLHCSYALLCGGGVLPPFPASEKPLLSAVSFVCV